MFLCLLFVLNCHSSSRRSPNSWLVSLPMALSLLHPYNPKESKMNWSCVREYAGGLAVSGSPTREPNSGIQWLPTGVSKPIAVYQATPWLGSSAATTVTTPCSASPVLWLVLSPAESKVMAFEVAPSCPMHSPICTVNAATPSILYQQNVILHLGDSGSVRELSDKNCRVVQSESERDQCSGL